MHTGRVAGRQANRRGGRQVGRQAVRQELTLRYSGDSLKGKVVVFYILINFLLTHQPTDTCERERDQ